MKKLLLIAMFAAFVPMQAHASVSVDKATSAEYLRANGYSSQIGETVEVSKSRALGQEYYTKDELAFKRQNKFVRFWRKLYVYTDPAAEDYSFYHHDNKVVPHYSDL